MQFFIQSDQAAATELVHVAVGGAVVSDQAIAAGVGSIPTPFAEIGSDLWFLHDQLTTQFLFGTGVGFINDGVSKDVDSRAMRKVEDGEDVAIVIENSTVGQGSITTTAGRMLVKLH